MFTASNLSPRCHDWCVSFKVKTCIAHVRYIAGCPSISHGSWRRVGFLFKKISSSLVLVAWRKKSKDPVLRSYRSLTLEQTSSFQAALPMLYLQNSSGKHNYSRYCDASYNLLWIVVAILKFHKVWYCTLFMKSCGAGMLHCWDVWSERICQWPWLMSLSRVSFQPLSKTYYVSFC